MFCQQLFFLLQINRTHCNICTFLPLFLPSPLTLPSIPPTPGSSNPKTYSINTNLCSMSYVSLLLQKQSPLPHFQRSSLNFVYPGHGQFHHDHILKVFQPFSSVQFVWWQPALHYKCLAAVRPAGLNLGCFSFKPLMLDTTE